MQGSFGVQGGRELAAKLSSLPNKISTGLVKQASLEAAELIRSDIISRAPHDTGFLQTHIIKRARAKGDLVKVIITPLTTSKKTQRRRAARGQSAKKDAFYARFIEQGTRKMSPRPFIRPAFIARKEEYAVRLLELLKPMVAHAIGE